MDGALKKGVILLVVLFLGFWLVQDPTGFGDSARNTFDSIWRMLSEVFAAVISFVQSATS